MKYYAIRNKRTGDLLRYNCTAVCYDDGEGGSLEHMFSEGKYDYVWLMGRRDLAEYALAYNTSYCNADYSSPSHPSNFNEEDYEVIEVEIVVKEK